MGQIFIMATTADVSIGTYIRHNGELCLITEYQHRTPGNLRAFYQAKMRNVKSGKSVEYRFRSGEEVQIVRVETKELQYLYKDGENLVLMDNDTFEQLYVEEIKFGDGAKFLQEGMTVQVQFEEETPIGGLPPTFVEMEITYTEPGLQGDTATKTLKPATIETGAQITVPLFCNIGDKVKIDTRTGEYMERVK